MLSVPGMLTLALSLALNIAPAEAPRPSVNTPAAARALDVRSVDSPAQVRALCEAIEPVERAAGRGDAVERSRAADARQARREEALAARYRVKIAADRLAFDEYDAGERVLALTDRTWLWTAGGALHLWATEDATLPVSVDEATAERIVRAAARRKLSLTLTFTLPDGAEAACAHPNGARRWTLGVEPQAWELAENGQVLARGGEGSDRPLVTVAQGARPRVEVAEPFAEEGGRALREAVAARSRELQVCYGRALAMDPALDGAVVTEIDLDGNGGAPRGVRVAADSVQDDAMVACVARVVAATPFPPGPATVAAIPIHFELEAPQASAQ
jgi:hypothetical protein